MEKRLFATFVFMLIVAVQAQGQVLRGGVKACVKYLPGVVTSKATQLATQQQHQDLRYRSVAPPIANPQNPKSFQVLSGKIKGSTHIGSAAVLRPKVVVASDSVMHVPRKNVFPNRVWRRG